MLREGQIRIPSGCAISGIINRQEELFGGTKIIDSIAVMHERSNGLGGGFAAYGIYPEFKDFFALHVMYDHISAKENMERYMNKFFDVYLGERIPVRKVSTIKDAPILWRYFVHPLRRQLEDLAVDENEYMARFAIGVNHDMEGTFIASSGKNMGVFKGVGYPEDIGDFFRLDEYKAYIWTAHGRFPTNTPGWWGGAHPFTLVDWSVVHNGEISSYDTNRRFIEMYGYFCSLQTDTEVITYLFDFLIRKHGLAVTDAVEAVAAPMWDELGRLDGQRAQRIRALRTVYASALLNGPFSIILASRNGIIGLNDRMKLRPMVAAEKGDCLYIASEEAAIRVIEPNPERVWAPRGGEPVIGLLNGKGDIIDRPNDPMSLLMPTGT